MKVFISWSGSLSHEVAGFLRDWLPAVLQSVDPFVSSLDIDKGARWGGELRAQLGDTDFGIVCLTRESIDSPWLNFEAGSLSKAVAEADVHVAPFLFGLRKGEVRGPLAQFQLTGYGEQEVRGLVASMNAACSNPLPDTRLAEAFRVWWPELKEKLDPLLTQVEGQTGENASSIVSSDRALLEEILERVRSEERLVQRSRNSNVGISPSAVHDLQLAWQYFLSALAEYGLDGTVPTHVMIQAARRLDVPISYMVMQSPVPQIVSPSLRDVDRALSASAEDLRGTGDEFR